MREGVDEVRLENSFLGSNVGLQLKFFIVKAAQTSRCGFHLNPPSKRAQTIYLMANRSCKPLWVRRMVYRTTRSEQRNRRTEGILQQRPNDFDVRRI